jgi:DNA-binding MarR family transcriptional regulator
MSDQELTPEQEMASGCLGARLRMLNRLVTNVYDAALRPHNVRVSQMNILVVIAVTGPVRGVDVARRLRMDTSTLSRDLDRLLERGWVQASPGVGRAQQLEVTAAGRKLLARILKDWREAQRQVRELLSPALSDALIDTVKSLWAGAEDAG